MPSEVGASLFVGVKELIPPFQSPRACCEARAGLFKSQGRSRKLFSPLWRSREVGASLFLCVKELIPPFQSPRACCEARAGLFKSQGRSRKLFSTL